MIKRTAFTMIQPPANTMTAPPTILSTGPLVVGGNTDDSAATVQNTAKKAMINPATICNHRGTSDISSMGFIDGLEVDPHPISVW